MEGNCPWCGRPKLDCDRWMATGRVVELAARRAFGGHKVSDEEISAAVEHQIRVGETSECPGPREEARP
jgi:hypothetical protein